MNACRLIQERGHKSTEGHRMVDWTASVMHLGVEKAEGAERRSEEAGEATSHWMKLIVVN